MKLLVFAHVPPPHHGQAVMVELMLRGLREKAETLKPEKLKFSEGMEGEPRIARSSRIEGKGETGVEGCSRTRERLDETTFDPDQNLTISATGDLSSGEEVGQARRCPSKEDLPSGKFFDF